MEISAERKKQLLKPPVKKPIVTLGLMLVCLFCVGEPNYQWVFQRGISAQKYFEALHNNNILDVVSMSFLGTFSQLGICLFLFNILFIWIFGSLIEKKLMNWWRYPVFCLVGIFGTWPLLFSQVQAQSPTQLFIGPSLFITYLLGAYLLFMPRKPYKPGKWTQSNEEFYREELKESLTKTPWVSPWSYVGLFFVYQLLLQILSALSREQLAEITHLGFMANVYQMILGTLTENTVNFLTLSAALKSLILGLFIGYLVLHIISRVKFLRSASDLQTQAILQYKQLRSLDMTHEKAVDGAAKLIGVPTEIAKDWINKGLPMLKEEEDK